MLKPKPARSHEIVRLVQSGKFQTQQCIADRVGLSRQRVSQVLQNAGIQFGCTKQPNTLLSWPCPGCGATVEMWSELRNHYPLDERVFCVACRKLRRREAYWVTLTCPDCGKTREIPRSQARHYKSPQCRSCWYKADMALARTPSHIKHRERLVKGDG